MLEDLLQVAEVLFDDDSGHVEPEGSSCEKSAGLSQQEVTDAITAGKDVYEIFFS